MEWVRLITYYTRSIMRYIPWEVLRIRAGLQRTGRIRPLRVQSPTTP
jgi:hypothetical protein